MNPCRFLRVGLCVFVALSFLACTTQTVIHERTSPYGTILVTEDSNGLRALFFTRGGSRQSVVKPGDPDHVELDYTRVALVGLALCEEPRRILVVGLGGGTLPSFLHRHYPDARIEAVEIDPDVVEVAKIFFDFREDGRMQVHVSDGRQFIEQTRQPVYDIIFLDAFGDQSVPPHLTTQEFLHAVRRALQPSGVVVGNLMSRAENPPYNAMVRTYQEVFDELFILDVAGGFNKILLALPRTQPMSQSELAQQARQISAAKQFRFDLGDLVDAGFVNTREQTYVGQVLRDADLGQ